jgi:hypothetical protein
LCRPAEKTSVRKLTGYLAVAVSLIFLLAWPALGGASPAGEARGPLAPRTSSLSSQDAEAEFTDEEPTGEESEEGESAEEEKPEGEGEGEGVHHHGHAPACVVPTVDGLSLNAARSVLSKAHCGLGKISFSRSRHGTLVVVWQSHTRGQRLTRGSAVALRLGAKSHHY